MKRLTKKQIIMLHEMLIEQAVQSGRISEERINESVLRILEKKDELGLI